MRFLSSLALAAVASAALADNFYEAQLRSGKAALASGQARAAADDLQIAAFGFLDRPALLCEALETLAVAQQTLGRAAAVDATLTRIVEANRALPACREANLDPQVKSEFDSLARRKLSAAVADEILGAPARATAAPVRTAPPPPAASSVASPRPTGLVPTPEPASTHLPAPTLVPAVPATRTPAGASEDLDRQPQLKATTRPVYPASAEHSGVGGIVLLRVLVSEKGEPLQVEVARGVQTDLDEAAVAAIRQWLFEPGRKAGKAVAAWMTVAVPFEARRK